MARNSNNVTPGVIVKAIRENQNNNGTLRSLFRGQFLGKFEAHELEGLKDGIERELGKKQQAVIDEKIGYLKNHGYNVKKG